VSPVVRLVEPARRGLGGRNQQLVLAALVHLLDDGAEGIALLLPLEGIPVNYVTV
jgi:hypothetical protein